MKVEQRLKEGEFDALAIPKRSPEKESSRVAKGKPRALIVVPVTLLIVALQEFKSGISFPTLPLKAQRGTKYFFEYFCAFCGKLLIATVRCRNVLLVFDHL